MLARVLDEVRSYGPATTVVVLGHGADRSSTPSPGAMRSASAITHPSAAWPRRCRWASTRCGRCRMRSTAPSSCSATSRGCAPDDARARGCGLSGLDLPTDPWWSLATTTRRTAQSRPVAASSVDAGSIGSTATAAWARSSRTPGCVLEVAVGGEMPDVDTPDETWRRLRASPTEAGATLPAALFAQEPVQDARADRASVVGRGADVIDGRDLLGQHAAASSATAAPGARALKHGLGRRGTDGRRRHRAQRHAHVAPGAVVIAVAERDARPCEMACAARVPTLRKRVRRGTIDGEADAQQQLIVTQRGLPVAGPELARGHLADARLGAARRRPRPRPAAPAGCHRQGRRCRCCRRWCRGSGSVPRRSWLPPPTSAGRRAETTGEWRSSVYVVSAPMETS